MKRKVLLLVVFVALAITLFAADPKLGKPTALQISLNQLQTVSVAGKNVKFEFGGDTWIATVDGANFMAGTFVSEDSETGSVLTLTQTHVYSDKVNPLTKKPVGWVTMSGPKIILDYKKGPPESLTVK
jgi:hypothetical protein